MEFSLNIELERIYIRISFVINV